MSRVGGWILGVGSWVFALIGAVMLGLIGVVVIGLRMWICCPARMLRAMADKAERNDFSALVLYYVALLGVAFSSLILFYLIYHE
jgi:nitrate/nitrite-specific signal transduction histidine kinase